VSADEDPPLHLVVLRDVLAECRPGDHAASFQPQLTAPTRLLLDLTGIASVDGWEAYLHAVVRSCAEPRHRVALVAPEPLTFGICRQTVLLANVAEGRAVAVSRSAVPPCRGSQLT
jgi:hypothetical protein